MKLALIIGMLILTGCASLEIENEAFTQTRMAHSSSIGTMYLTSATHDGDHNCDDTPSNCCATGYHMCTAPEIIHGGREVEDTGTGRDTTPIDASGWIDTFREGDGDCSGWSTTAVLTGMRATLGSSDANFTTVTTSTCSSAIRVWCCSP